MKTSRCPRKRGKLHVHHLDHWADGGKTVLTNLTLLCRYHHTLTHQQDAQDRFDQNFKEEQPANTGQTKP